MEKQQIIQENQYNFPYHYLVELVDDEVSMSKYWGWGLQYLGRLWLVQDVLNSIDFKLFLDIGCGDGRLVSLIARKHQNCNFYGVDYSKRAVGLAKNLNFGLSNARFLHLDILKNSNKSLDVLFDVLTLIEVIEHIPPEEVINFVSASCSYLKEGGTLILTVPSKNLPLAKKHYQHFDRDKLVDILTKSGLKVERCEYIDSTSGFIMKILLKLLRNRIFTLNSKFLVNKIFKFYRCNNLVNRSQDGEGLIAVCRKA